MSSNDRKGNREDNTGIEMKLISDRSTESSDIIASTNPPYIIPPFIPPIILPFKITTPASTRLPLFFDTSMVGSPLLENIFSRIPLSAQGPEPRIIYRAPEESPANSEDTARAMYEGYWSYIGICARAELKKIDFFPDELINTILYFLCGNEFEIVSRRASAASSQPQLALMSSLDVAEKEYEADPQG